MEFRNGAFSPARVRTVFAGLLAVAVGCGGSSPAPSDAATDARAGGADRPGEVRDADETRAAVCPWELFPRELILPSSEVSGALAGPSRNASTTCTRQRGTGGPEAVYLLRLSERTVVELEVVSEIDTVIAIRTACSDPLTELACNDSPATMGVDAGPPPGFPVSPDAGVSEGRDAKLRVSLPGGTYHVIVDEAEPFGVGGRFTLKARSMSPPAQSTCFGAPALSDGASLPAEQLDLGDLVVPPCLGTSGTGPRTLYYAVRVPPGQRVTARARAIAGDRSWEPVVQVLSGCAASGEVCLGASAAVPNGDQVLRYVNNAATEEQVLVAVSASNRVVGGVFRLDLAVREPTLNFACANATPVGDGQTLHGQDLAEGQSPPLFCGNDGGPSLFYRLHLLPYQSLEVHAAVRNPTVSGPVNLTLHDGCSAQGCVGLNEGVPFFNGPKARTVLVQATTIVGTLPPVFDLTVEAPLPPGRIEVAPRAGLVTSEAGATATFDVVLAAPPHAPVTIAVTSSNLLEAMARPASLRFDPATWDRPLRVTVVGVDDLVADGARPISIRLAPAESADPRYQGLDAADVEVTNLDDEPGFRVTGLPIGTTESGTRASVVVSLNRAPSATVRLPLRSTDEAEGKVSPSELVFQPASWQEPRRFEVVGQDDDARDGTRSYRIALGPATSADPAFAGVDPPDLDARNADDDLVSVAAARLQLPVCSSKLLPGGARLAVDAGGTLYAVLHCDRRADAPAVDAGATPGAGAPGDGGAPGDSPPPSYLMPVYIVAIGDGGRAIGAPRLVGDASRVQVTAGAAGHVAVLLHGEREVAVAHSEDGGANWRVEALGHEASRAYVAADGTHLAMAAVVQEVPTVWNSTDFGRTFTSSTFEARGELLALSVQPDDALWMVTHDTGVHLVSSRDGGRSITTSLSALAPDLFNGVIAFSRTHVFGLGAAGRLFVAPLEMPQEFVRIAGVTSGFEGRAMTVHANGGLTVIDAHADEGSPVLRHLKAGAQMFSEARDVATAFEPPASVAALSNQAVAVLLHRNGQAWLSVEAFP